ncbi:hypothetical protein ACHAWO_004216 [Cyclotella atomus]|uniref:Fucolectin tachylectin-4 pentraxin-1 domain-containing protein n=1 Tax=Cyclotella atomus TaxID=382360 RepID=A0ABD3RB90_9STRA
MPSTTPSVRPSPPTPTSAPTLQCCVNGFCPPDALTRELPLLNLSVDSALRPDINGEIDQDGDGIGDNITGWNGTEYYPSFARIDMFVGGKNEDPNSEKIATAYIAYDCHNHILCAAAHLNADYMAANPDVHVVEDEDESWIRLGGNASDPKLTQSIADEFTYVMKPPDSAYTIGYEGCWNVSGLGASVMNNFVEVHFVTNKKDTISTGKPVLTGDYVCLKTTCAASFIPTPAADRSSCLVTKVKIESTTENALHFFEVQMLSYPNAINVALQGIASQSSTYLEKNRFAAGRAIDNSTSTFSHTSFEGVQWWEVKLMSETDLSVVKVLNRYCVSSSDPHGCLCRLSNAQISLYSGAGNVIFTRNLGDTCGQSLLVEEITSCSLPFHRQLRGTSW